MLDLMYLALPLCLLEVLSILGTSTDAPSLFSMVRYACIEDYLYKTPSIQILGAEPHFPGSQWGFVVSLPISR
jgi:hypothetical protein